MHNNSPISNQWGTVPKTLKEENRKLKFKDDESNLEITLKNKIENNGEYFIIKGENFCMLKNGRFFEKIDEGKDLFGEDKEILEKLWNHTKSI